MGEYNIKHLIKDYWGILEGYRIRFTVLTLLKALLVLAGFLVAYLMGKIVDFFTTYQQGQPLTSFYVYLTILTIWFGSTHILRFMIKFRMYKVAAKIRQKARVLAMNKLIELDLKWHEKDNTGAKVTKIGNGSSNLYTLVKLLANEGLTILINIGGAIILFIGIDIRYALFAIIYVIIYLSLEKHYNKKIQYWSNELNKISEQVSGKYTESASNLLTVKSMGLKQNFENYTKEQEEKYLEIWEHSLKANQTKSKIVKTFGSLAVAGFLLLLGLDTANGLITVGSFIVYNSFFSRINKALFDITNISTNFIKIQTAAGRFFEFLNEKVSKYHGEKKFPKWKQLTFKNINFKYKNKLVLKKFSLTVNKGEKIGVVGISGSGKSTITKILLGLYPVTSGNIKLDKINLKEIKHEEITKNIGIVLQESELFNSSLEENIKVSRIEDDKNEYKKAVEISKVDEIISKLPQKSKTLIGEKGYKLSGGERQRIGIARALYKPSQILILDEATSSLDSKTEKKIQEGIDNLDRTVIIIAHRISTLKNVDKIVYLEKGKICEKGSYKELIKKKGKFYELYKLQQKK